VLVVREYILHLLVKRAGRESHSFVGQIVQAFFPYPDSGNATVAWYVERKIGSARLQIALDVAATEGDICFPNDLLKRV
jgi:hypothetical protein